MICLYQQEGCEFYEPIKEALNKQFNLNTLKAGEFKIPSASFNPFRNQYEALKIIELLQRHLDKRCDKHLIIVDVDIYTPRFNFIFGMAETQTNTAIVSIWRLSEKGLTKERLKKEVVHEIGHLLGLGHCLDPFCNMYFSKTINDTDRKKIELCEECRRKIERI